MNGLIHVLVLVEVHWLPEIAPQPVNGDEAGLVGFLPLSIWVAWVILEASLKQNLLVGSLAAEFRA